MMRDDEQAMNKLVLLSGGMDSVAALHWSIQGGLVRAVFFDYGQPQRDAEVVAAGVAAREVNVPMETIVIAEAVRGLGLLDPPARGSDAGISRANLPARNAILLSCAAARLASYWPGDGGAIVIGSNKDDAAVFPDCRGDFLYAFQVALSAALQGVCRVEVVAPWLTMSKVEIALWCRTNNSFTRDAVARSSSCYRGNACGECDACALRQTALASAGITDEAPRRASLRGGECKHT